MATIARPPREHIALVVCIGLLTGAAWLSLWLSSGARHGLHHFHHLGEGAMPLFVAGWTVMTVAMMLPTTVPILTVLNRFAARRADRPLLLGLAILGYLAAWTVFGTGVYAGGRLLHLALGGWPWLAEHASAGAPLLLVAAGAFQFSSLKYRCLEKCRSPLGFVISYWRGRRERWHSFRLGVDHGVFCVGCCWALMLLMFAVGSGSLAWMFVLAIVMAIEKNMPWGRRISAPVGVALMVWGGVLLAAG